MFRLPDELLFVLKGMNRVAAFALLFLKEEDAFWCLVAIIDFIMPQDYFSISMVAAQADQVTTISLLHILPDCTCVITVFIYPYTQNYTYPLQWYACILQIYCNQSFEWFCTRLIPHMLDQNYKLNEMFCWITEIKLLLASQIHFWLSLADICPLLYVDVYQSCRQAGH